MTAINDKLLEDRLGTLEAARSWSPRVVSRLEALIRSGEGDALFRVNPIKFAADKGMADRPLPLRHRPRAVRDELDAALLTVRLRDRELQRDEQAPRSSALQSVPH